ncbi:ATP synthase subunit s, mitochondrial isoform X4 [Hydra vulgaris]|uniref:ATP synthase subunit s, mitochondrial isoform X4 n=1 Tax=Hydra vulgaris TaxID=6087 RepID=A0ABM4CKH7_HYDVU
MAACRFIQSKNVNRFFYSWLIEVFNSPNEERIKQFGPDRAAAEWIIRNGGKVKFESHITWSTSYSTLSNSCTKLVAIDGSNIALTSNGLRHLKGLNYLTDLLLRKCPNITFLDSLEEVSASLKHLDISYCESITDISPVAKLRNLETLVVSQTLIGSMRDETIKRLQLELPQCKIID